MRLCHILWIVLLAARYAELTESAGIRFRHQHGGSGAKPITIGGGAKDVFLAALQEVPTFRHSPATIFACLPSEGVR